jgi:hypothetical protein
MRHQSIKNWWVQLTRLIEVVTYVNVSATRTLAMSCQTKLIVYVLRNLESQTILSKSVLHDTYHDVQRVNRQPILLDIHAPSTAVLDPTPR